MCLTLATPWTVARQAPQSMGFPRQEYWSELPFPSPGDLPHSGMRLVSSAMADRFLPVESPFIFSWKRTFLLQRMHSLKFCWNSCYSINSIQVLCTYCSIPLGLIHSQNGLKHFLYTRQKMGLESQWWTSCLLSSQEVGSPTGQTDNILWYVQQRRPQGSPRGKLTWMFPGRDSSCLGWVSEDQQKFARLGLQGLEVNGKPGNRMIDIPHCNFLHRHVYKNLSSPHLQTDSPIIPQAGHEHLS